MFHGRFWTIQPKRLTPRDAGFTHLWLAEPLSRREKSVEQQLTSFSGTAVQCKFLICASPDFCHLRCRVHKLSLICASRIISIVMVQVPKSRRTPPRFAPIGEQQSYANAGVADATAVIRDWLGYTMRSYAATAITNAGRFCNK